MIVANVATYPLRKKRLSEVIGRLSNQVDKINLVLNEFNEPLAELLEFGNVEQIIPDHDTKDAGKFYPDISDAEYVFSLDDDILFPADFVEKTLRQVHDLGPKTLAGYHASLYRRPKPSLNVKKLRKWLEYHDGLIAAHRKVFTFHKGQKKRMIVDQVASGTAVMAAADFPPYEYMQSSQKFVDVRLAKWCFEKQIKPVVLPREENWMQPLRYEETIFDDFTLENPPHVAEEIHTFAFKVPGRGTQV